jgi:hypothetical protein
MRGIQAIDIFLSVAGVVVTIVSGIRVVPGYGDRRRGAEIDEVVRSEAERGGTYAEVAQRLAARFSAATVRRHLDRYLATENDLLRRADEALLPLLPANPRAVKRLSNQLHLAIFVAAVRGLLIDAAVTPAHLAKWVVLRDQYPEFADSIATDPALLAAYETAPETATLDCPPGLRALLGREPKLGPALAQLLHLVPPTNTDDR